MDKNLFFEEIMSGLQSLKNLILEAKKELGEISESAIMKLNGEDDLIYENLWTLVNTHVSEENKPAYFKWLENHKFSLSNIRWTETDQKNYNTVLDGLKYANEVLVNNKLLDMAKDISFSLDWLSEFKEKMYAIARKEVEYDVSTCGRRGRMGGVPQEFSEKAEEYQKGIKPPYDADDIISAYESGMMEEEKEVDKAYKTQDDVVFRKGLSEGRKATLDGLPKWRYAEREMRSSVIEYLVEYYDDSGDGEPIHAVIPTNYVEPCQRYMEIDDSFLRLDTVIDSIDGR